jgi:hypothetical protein
MGVAIPDRKCGSESKGRDTDKKKNHVLSIMSTRGRVAVVASRTYSKHMLILHTLLNCRKLEPTKTFSKQMPLTSYNIDEEQDSIRFIIRSGTIP